MGTDSCGKSNLILLRKKEAKSSEEADPVTILLKDTFPFKCKNSVIDFDIKASHQIASKC